MKTHLNKEKSLLTEYSKTYVPQYTLPVEITKKHDDVFWKETEIKLFEDLLAISKYFCASSAVITSKAF